MARRAQAFPKGRFFLRIGSPQVLHDGPLHVGGVDAEPLAHDEIHVVDVVVLDVLPQGRPAAGDELVGVPKIRQAHLVVVSISSLAFMSISRISFFSSSFSFIFAISERIMAFFVSFCWFIVLLNSSIVFLNDVSRGKIDGSS